LKNYYFSKGSIYSTIVQIIADDEKRRLNYE